MFYSCLVCVLSYHNKRLLTYLLTCYSFRTPTIYRKTIITCRNGEFLPLSVCLSVRQITQKPMNGFWRTSLSGGAWPKDQSIRFWWQSGSRRGWSRVPGVRSGNPGIFIFGRVGRGPRIRFWRRSKSRFRSGNLKKKTIYLLLWFLQRVKNKTCLSAFYFACQNYRIGHKCFNLLGDARYTVLHAMLRDVCIYQPREILTDCKYIHKIHHYLDNLASMTRHT